MTDAVADYRHPVELDTELTRRWHEGWLAALPDDVPRTRGAVVRVARAMAEQGLLAAVSVEVGPEPIWVVDRDGFDQRFEAALRDAFAGEHAVAVRAAAQLPARSFPTRLRGAASRVARWPALCRRLRQLRLLDDRRLIDVLHRQGVGPVQRLPEITALAGLVRARGVGSILEIGTANAGTFVYLANVVGPGATLVTLDIAPSPGAAPGARMIPSGSTASFEVGDSHTTAVIDDVHRRWPDGFDLVFIDGDHSYAGVRADALAYADLARPGGLLAFHDIVPSISDRTGIETMSVVGGVPRWWTEIGRVGGAHLVRHEFVAHRAQDGMGIGVVEVPVDPTARAALLDALRTTAAE